MCRRLVEFRNVSFRYSEDRPWVLDDCSFTIGENESVAIIGHNGSGKSTIAKLMNGLQFPQKGEIIIDGRLVCEESIREIRQDVGMVFQNPDNQFVGTTVQDDVAFGMENRGVSRDVMIKRVEHSLTAVGMKDYQLAEPHRLSGGQKQRVAIAGVLAVSPKVMILDEATAMLDPNGRNEIMQTISRLQEEQVLSLVIITHDLHEIVQAGRVIVLNEGKIWDDATPRDIFNKKNELQQIGLDVPFITLLADELKKVGISFTKEPLNHDELLEELWTLYSKT